jgi:phage terminase large subunit
MNRAEFSSKQNNLLTIRRYYEKNTQSNYNYDVLFRI